MFCATRCAVNSLDARRYFGVCKRCRFAMALWRDCEPLYQQTDCFV